MHRVGGLITVCLVALAAINGISRASAIDASFEIDLSQPTTPFPHFWSRCVGSGHAALALREDWRQALAQSQSALGWEYIRFHGILDDDMSVVIAPGQYSFYDIDSVYDFLQSISMRPIVELSFMPTALASGNQTIFYYKGNITPPADYNQWTDLITSLMTHLVERYGLDEVAQWYFEVWNEPNCGFWSGSQQEYFTLLKHTYQAIKSVSPRLRVGGPATCQSQWIAETLQFCEANNIKLDFVSTHEYPTDPTNGDRRTLMQDVMTATRNLARSAGDIPVIYTEFNSGLFGDTPNHDLPYAAAFTVDMVQRTQGLVEMASYWTFSDIFEEGGFQPTPFHDMYGMVTNIGVPKPAYHAFELLHRAGTERVTVRATTNDTNTTNVWAVRDDSMLTVFITNFDYYEFPVSNKSIQVTIPGIAAGGSPQGETYLIDATHANPRAAWEAMGSPTYPTQLQIAELQAAAQMTPQALVYVQSGANIAFEVMLAPFSVFTAFIPLQYSQHKHIKSVDVEYVRAYFSCLTQSILFPP